MKRLFYVAFCLLLTAMLFGCSLKSAVSEPSSPRAATSPSTQMPGAQASSTTGMPGNTRYAPVAVSIDNSANARPQTGLQSADIVYEMEAEGAIPRFLALFNDNLPKKVGPVRSARVYFLDVLLEYDAMLVHVGGPKGRDNGSDVYKKFDQLDIQHIDGEGQYIWRDSSRSSPYNCYTNIAADQNTYTYQPQTRAFSYTTDTSGFTESGTQATVPYNTGINKAVYDYDAAQGVYLRSNGATPLTDAQTQRQIQIKNVIIQFADHPRLDTVHIDIELVGTGKAYVLTDGKCIEGTWSRKGLSSKTIFSDEHGREISLQPGNTWINIVRTDCAATVE